MNLDSSLESGSRDITANAEQLKDIGQAAVPFDGDAFGNAQDYASEDFGQQDAMELEVGEVAPEPDVDELDLEDEHVAAAEAAELETGWEPH